MTVRSQLNRYLSGKDKVETGVVVRITETSIVAATSNGLKEFPASLATSRLKAKDRVRFKGDTYLGRVDVNPKTRVYTV